jgi:membrane fusion protein (multidrug efflux system)
MREAQAGIPLAEAQVAEANANFQKAQTDYDRYNSLFKQGAIAKQELDTAKAAYDVAQAQKNSALQIVQQAKSRLAQTQEGIVSAQARLAASGGELEQAEASGQQTTVNQSEYEAAQSAIAQSAAMLKDAQLQLSYIDVFATSTGRIGKKNVEVGNRIQVGAPLMAIVENNYWIVANFKETQLNRIKTGQSVEVKLDAFPDHTFTGRVDSIAPASGSQFSLLPPDNATGNFTKIVQRISVKITLDPQSMKGYESRITAGMSAEVTVEIK